MPFSQPDFRFPGLIIDLFPLETICAQKKLLAQWVSEWQGHLLDSIIGKGPKANGCQPTAIFGLPPSLPRACWLCISGERKIPCSSTSETILFVSNSVFVKLNKVTANIETAKLTELSMSWTNNFIVRGSKWKAFDQKHEFEKVLIGLSTLSSR